MPSLVIKSPKHGDYTVYYDKEDDDLVGQYYWYPQVTKKGRVTAVTAFYSKETQNSRVVPMHQIITGRKGIDHKDRNPLNNKRGNLRTATQSQNAKNQKRKSNNTSGYKGVSFDKAKEKYSCHITYNYKHIFCGYFNNPIDAAKKYNEAALKYFKEFACLNEITKEDEDKYAHIKGRFAKPRSVNTSGYRGVRKYRENQKTNRRWFAQITVDGKIIHIGSFFTKKEAALAYNEAALNYFGDNALLNKIK